ncbi:MAG: iron-containing alcohol dehydrogenase [Defluviitaleaceae bacterium]|nr:iron-containing alcohol dehydrogenase [Defluviitaleaceae bacterium]
MATRFFYSPQINLLGAGCVQEVGAQMKALGFKKALVVTDKILVQNGIVAKVTDTLVKKNITFVLYDEISPNPTCAQVHKGFDLLTEHGCDCIVTVGGGSPQDAGSAMGILATNGGNIRDYEGIHKSAKPGMPTIAVNTTAGTSAELTINYVITDEDRAVKMVMVDKNSIATMSVSDPELMIGKPADLTAATGMDTLTHAIECLLTKGAYAVSDCMALECVKIVFKYLPTAVKDGTNLEAREQMTYANFLIGLAFSNAGLGYVHSMAHQLGGIYDLPHGVCNAMLLPIVTKANAAYAPDKIRLIAAVLGANAMSDAEYADFVLNKIKSLSEEIGIPKTLDELGITNPDFDRLAESALKDVCTGGNPFQPTKEQTIAMYKALVK